MSLDKFLLIQFDEERKGFKKTDSVITDTMNRINKTNPYLIIVCTQNSLSGALWLKTFQTVLGNELKGNTIYKLLSKIDATRASDIKISSLFSRDKKYNVRTRIYYDPDKIILGFRNNSLPTKSSFKESQLDRNVYTNVYNSNSINSINNHGAKIIIKHYAIRRTTLQNSNGGKILCSLFIQEPGKDLYNLVISNSNNLVISNSNNLGKYESNIKKNIYTKMKNIKYDPFSTIANSNNSITNLNNPFDNLSKIAISNKSLNRYIYSINEYGYVRIPDGSKSIPNETVEILSSKISHERPVILRSVSMNNVASVNNSARVQNPVSILSKLVKGKQQNSFLKDNILLVNYDEAKDVRENMVQLIKKQIKKQNPAVVIVCTQTTTPSKQLNLQALLVRELNGYLLKKDSRISENVHAIGGTNSGTNSNLNNIITTVYYNQICLSNLKITINIEPITKYIKLNKTDGILLKLSINKRINSVNTNTHNFIIYNYLTDRNNQNISRELDQLNLTNSETTGYLVSGSGIKIYKKDTGFINYYSSNMTDKISVLEYYEDIITYGKNENYSIKL
jgi:hypothetical protein